MKIITACLAAMGSVGAELTETSIPKNCKLLDGYDLIEGCLPSPVALPTQCGDPPGKDACLYDDSSVGRTTQYLNKMTSTRDQSDFFSNVASAEGGGWGISVSTSVGVM